MAHDNGFTGYTFNQTWLRNLHGRDEEFPALHEEPPEPPTVKLGSQGSPPHTTPTAQHCCFNSHGSREDLHPEDEAGQEDQAEQVGGNH